MAMSIAFGGPPPSLTLPHTGGGDSLAMASLSLIPSPLMGEG
jgi:hypothetical protein